MEKIDLKSKDTRVEVTCSIAFIRMWDESIRIVDVLGIRNHGAVPFRLPIDFINQKLPQCGSRGVSRISILDRLPSTLALLKECISLLPEAFGPHFCSPFHSIEPWQHHHPCTVRQRVPLHHSHIFNQQWGRTF